MEEVDRDLYEEIVEGFKALGLTEEDEELISQKRAREQRITSCMEETGLSYISACFLIDTVPNCLNKNEVFLAPRDARLGMSPERLEWYRRFQSNRYPTNP